MQQIIASSKNTRTSTTNATRTRQMTDLELVSAARNGNEFALRQLCDRHSRLIVKLTSRFFYSPADIAQLTQTCLAELARTLHRFGVEGPRVFTKWLAHLVVGVCYIEMRRRSYHHSESFAPVARFEAETQPTRKDAHRALAQLDPLDRVVTTLLLAESWTLDELAELTGLSPVKVAERVRHACSAWQRAGQVAFAEQMLASPKSVSHH